MKRVILKKTTKLLLLCFTLTLAAFSFALVGCGQSGDSEGTFPATVGDLYIKQGDSTFDFEKGLPDGVTIDCSKVNVDTIGTYEIVYKKDGKTTKKTAFVFGMPVFSKDGGAVKKSYDVSYKQANEMDFFDANTFGIIAKDSFDNAVEIAAQMDRNYIGDYGNYEVKYSATDLAGNTAVIDVTYNVSGATAPTVSIAGKVDVADNEINIMVPLTEPEQNSLYLYVDGKYIEFSQYEKDGESITLSTEIFREDLLAGKSDFELKIDTAEWYVKTNINFRDEKPLVYDKPVFDGRAYMQAESITLPVPQKLMPQNFRFEYEIRGGDCVIEVTNGGETVTLTNRDGGVLSTGNYTFTIKGVRDEEVVRTDTADFKILTKDEYADTYVRDVARLDSAENNTGLRAKNDSFITFAYDESMGAYKVTPLKNTQSHENSVMVEGDSETYTKLKDGCDLFTYLAFNMYFSAPGSENGIMFFVATEDGKNTSHGYWFSSELTYTRADNNMKLENYLAVQSGVWYTIYIQTGGLMTEVPGGYDFFDQAICEGNDSNSAYWVKNIRFEKEIPKYVESKIAANNYIYEVSDTAYRLPEKLGETPTLMGPSGNISLESGTFTMREPGEYTATGNGHTVKFTVYTAENFKKQIAPLNSDQFDYAIAANNADYATFTFDAEKNAYKVHHVKPDNDANNAIVLLLGTDICDKMTTGCEDYTYLAMDMYFTAEQAAGMIWWMALEDKSQSQHSWHYGQVNYVDMETRVQAESFESVQAGKWYTVYIQTGGLLKQYGKKWFISQKTTEGENSDYWVKNIRFEEGIDAVPPTPPVKPEKFIAALTSEQTDNAFAAANKEFATFTFDTAKSAYKVTHLQADSEYNNAVIVNAETEAYNRIVAGCGEYEYIVMDMYFSVDQAGGNVWHMNTGNADSPYYRSWFGEIKYLDLETGSVCNDYTEVKANRWYSVYVPATGFAMNFGTRYWFVSQVQTEGAHHDYWLKNIRFEEGINTELYNKIVASLTSEQSELTTNSEYAEFTFDAEKSAYHWKPIQVNSDDMNAIVMSTSSVAYNKIVAGCESYSYLAMDMYFTAEKAAGMMWWMAVESGDPTYHGHYFGQVVYVDTETGIAAQDYLSVSAGKWYTVYIQTGGLTKNHGNQWFISQRASDNANHDFWIKNIRFENTIQTAQTSEGEKI